MALKWAVVTFKKTAHSLTRSYHTWN